VGDRETLTAFAYGIAWAARLAPGKDRTFLYCPKTLVQKGRHATSLSCEKFILILNLEEEKLIGNQ
jgi:hypothetical protein